MSESLNLLLNTFISKITVSYVYKWPFELHWQQVPVKLAFSMTINKSQGWNSGNKPSPVFFMDLCGSIKLIGTGCSFGIRGGDHIVYKMSYLGLR